KKERDVSGYLEKLEREERLTRELLSGIEEKEQMLSFQVEELRKDLENNEKIYRHRLCVLTERLRDMYKGRTSHEWQELLDASDFADLLQRYKFLTLVAERDASLVEDVKQRRAAIEKQEAAITELLYEASVSRREKEDELQKLQENEEERKNALVGLQADKQKYQKAAGELEKAENDLQNLIEVLEKQRVEQAQEWGDYGEGDFIRLKGKLSAPADGPIIRSFGRFKHPEYGTVTFNTGVDIGARSGSPVKAVARGRVEYASALPGYGNCIIINHGGGYYTLYAHTSRIFVKQGEQIERGKVIAEAGEGAQGAESPLHFEIRKSKKALDPAEWMGR
ncbi:MAG: peptidoglycan DD-metalloendopeptidase family protein, partial [Thermoplasmata archaeon]|nr:peptidoglycan DD-metalloendopeptidase family protein [Thermoplasmata archaeon]